ncbi:MAG: glycoside hydrolase family 3 protein [Pseudonocardiales bacterium]|nr:glycoside hydrolase family 3 protein [Pseudonocardiales bacterium]MBV9032188.1 glycoside hydrolase family 3 protein [Pseudonocardiales bacterium]MBW0011446.1 glycoside hydrolase family 3 protein [Pseudonocardiales bacterium]
MVLVVCVATVVGVRAARGGAQPLFSTQCTQESAIAQLPIRRRLAQMMMVGVDARGPQGALAVVTSEQVGGIFLTGSATGLLSGNALWQVQDTAVVPLAVAVDDEGGRVQRIDALDGQLPSPRWMAANLRIEQVYELAVKRGSRLRARGVTIDFAPSVDVSSQPNNAVIGDRSFSSDPQTVTRYAGAFAQGLRAAGVLPVFKHFPGHGRAIGDSHRGVVSTPPLTELREVDLVPYRQLLDGRPAAVMVGHLDVPGLTEPGTPASISPAALALLRDRFRFTGMVLSDDLGAMAAITDRVDLPEAVRRSLTAGVDMALWVTTGRLTEVLDHLEQAVVEGSLPQARVNDAVAHVLATKAVDLCSAAHRTDRW